VVVARRIGSSIEGKGWAAGAMLLAGLLMNSVARAEDVSANATRLSFVRAESASDCSPAPVLEREIARRMGRDPFVGVPRQWIEGFIARQGDYFEVQLFERDANGNTLGTRRLRESAKDCHRLDDAMVLAIALIIDPTAQLAPAMPSGVPSAPTAIDATQKSVAPAAAVEEVVPVPATSSERVVPTPLAVDRAAPTSNMLGQKVSSAMVTADAVLLYGALPGVAPGAELTTKLYVDDARRYALRLSMLYLPEKRDTTSAGTLGYGLTAMEAGLCLGNSDQRVAWQGCTALSLGAVHAVVHDPVPFEPGDRLWAAWRGEAGAALRVAGPLWLDARLFALVVPRTWDFRVKVEDSVGQRAFLQRHFVPGGAFGLALAF
jgi:hypothetical protein